MKETFEIIKKLWENKKTRAIAILVLYVIFFAFVISIIQAPDEVQVVETSSFDTILKYQIDKIEISGEDNFVYVNNQIIYEDNTYEIGDVSKLDIYDLSIFSISNIHKLLKKASLENTNYLEHSNTYYMSYADFNKIVGSEESGAFNVHIKLYDDYSKVIIDLNECCGYEAQIDLRS